MASLKKEIIKGSMWMAIAKYSGIVVQLLITAILARLIAPAAFGTVAIAIVVLNFLDILADIGIGPAVVQFKQLTKRHLDSLFTLNTYIGIALSVGLFMLSGWIADYYQDVVLEKVCMMMSLVIFFNSLNVVPNALMSRDKRFKTIALRTLFFKVTTGCIAVWGAFNGWGVYALIVSPILTSIGVFLVNYYNYPLRFVMHMSHEAVKTVSSFSIFQFAFSFVNYFSRNLDKLIIGKYYSMTQLGYYDKSYNLMRLPLQNITFVIHPVLHPILSSLQDNKEELAEKNRKLAVALSNISFPIGLILFFCGGELIRIVYGSQWDAAIPVFRILALSLPLQMILSMVGPIYQAAGRTDHMFYVGMINTSVTVCGFLVAAFWSREIEAMAWAWVITLTINFFISYSVLHKFTLGQKVFTFYRAIIPQLLNSSVVFLILIPFARFLDGANIFLTLISKSILIAVLTIVFAYFLHQYKIIELLKSVKSFTIFN